MPPATKLVTKPMEKKIILRSFWFAIDVPWIILRLISRRARAFTFPSHLPLGPSKPNLCMSPCRAVALFGDDDFVLVGEVALGVAAVSACWTPSDDAAERQACASCSICPGW